jgi:3-oxoadipate enol-lactonase
MAVSSVLPCDDRGAGDPVVLLHGFPLHRGIWKGQLESLAAKSRTIAFDLPGFGQAGGMRTPESLEGITAVVDSSLHSIASPAAILVGHSLGGYMALQQYADHPERVRALVLVSTRAAADSPEGAAKRHATISRLRQEGPGSFAVETARNLLAPSNASKPELFVEVLQMVRSAPVQAMVSILLAMVSRPDFTEMLGDVKVPTLVIWGEEDRTIPADDTKKLVKAIPKAKGVGISGAGHLPFLENPSAFNQAVLEFLSGLPAPGEEEREEEEPVEAAPAQKKSKSA